MTGIYRPNFAVLGNWRSTLAAFFQQIRKVAFVTEGAFAFGDFDPQFDWKLMAVTSVRVDRARYLKIWNMLWFSLDFRATLAAPLASNYSIRVPGTLADPDTAVQESQGGSCYLANNAVAEVGLWFGTAGADEVFIQRVGGAFTAGITRVILNGFVEVNTNG